MPSLHHPQTLNHSLTDAARFKAIDGDKVQITPQALKETSKARHRSRTYLEHSCASVERNAPAGEKVQGLRAGVDFLEEVENFLVPRFRRQLGVHSQVSHDLEVGPHGVGEADQHRDFRDEPKGLVLLLELTDDQRLAPVLKNQMILPLGKP